VTNIGIGKPFETNIGAPRGDSLNPVLFIIYTRLPYPAVQ
jgi:hypothetical protein